MPNLTIKKPKLPINKKSLVSGSKGESSKKIGLNEVISKYQSNTCCMIGLSDATGSMNSIWSETKAQLTEMIYRIQELGEFKLKWVAYRDYTDGNGLLESSKWETSSQPLLNFINSIECYGGDDWEEAVEKALEFSAEDDQATSVLLIGDAPPHTEKDYRYQARRLGKMKRPVFSFVVDGNEDTFRAFSEISRLSGGTCCYLNDVNDLIDVVVITAAHDIGGNELILEYTKKYSDQLTLSGKQYSSKLLSKASE